MRFDRTARRRWVNHLAGVATLACVGIALIPLASILFEAASRGLRVLSVSFLISPEPTPCSPIPGVACATGGIAPALEGTLVLIGLSSVIALPVGILAGAYLSEYGRHRPGRTVSFLADVMTGFPSIVVGVFVYALFLLFFPQIVFSTLSGTIALAIIMIPIVARTTEDALRLVPSTVREAALALGIPRYRTTLWVVLASGRSALLTGAVLAVMRGGGEAAPLLLTAFGNPHGFQGVDQPTEAVPPLIFNFATQPYANWQSDAWGAALVLILLMLGVSVTARVLLRRKFGG
jgi:phosphate transport system permease protein